jgi:cephalosporin hydroxylase
MTNDVTPYDRFKRAGAEEVDAQGRDADLRRAGREWFVRANAHRYSYHFEWLGRPVIQYPQDLLAMQEIAWRVQPALIIETGIAHGGSLVFWASMLELNAACGGPPDATVLGIDIDIRAHNRAAIDAHPMSRRIAMLEGSSIAPEIATEVRRRAAGRHPILVCLDSNHTHDHVLAELEAYASLTSVGSYCIVFDTIIEDMPPETYSDRPWGPGNNPRTAVDAFLRHHQEFEVDSTIDDKILVSMATAGYLRRTR